MVNYRDKRRRRATSTAMTLPAGRFGVIPYAAKGAARAIPYAHAAELGYQYAQNIHKIAKGMGMGKTKTTPLKQTAARRRSAVRNRGRGRPPASKGLKANRHEKLNMSQGTKMNKGKGYNSSATGTIITHPNSRIPKWKKDRIYKYKYDVWQTVLLSRSNRLAASNNTLETTRYPLKMPECLDSERTQAVVFTPFCSHLSGVHTTYFRKIQADGTDLDHDTTNRLDVIQNKADIDRFRSDTALVEGNDGGAPLYIGTAEQSVVANATNINNIFRRFDQLVKEVHLDLVFMASRAFPVRVSVSMIRAIKPQPPFELTTNNKRDLCNGISNHGCDWNEWKTEYHHEFTLPALAINKKPATYNVKKILKTNFLQTNSFNENTTAHDMAQAAKTGLGLNINSHTDEIADGNMSGNFYILIKYRKVQQPQQFTYQQTIDSNRGDYVGAMATAKIEVPVLSEESFNVLTTDGDSGGSGGATDGANDGSPFKTDQGDESKASFYLNGKLKYKWGFRKECEAVPAIMSFTDASNNYKKPQSINVDPTILPSDTTNGLYQASPDHVNIAASTANTGI